MCIREVKPDPFKQFFNISHFTKVPSILVTYFIHMIHNISESCDVKKSPNLSLNLFSSKSFSFHFL